MLNTQYVTLSMIPSGVMPVLYCSQYDVGRPLGFVVNNGSEVVNLDQYMVAIEGTRSDGTGIVADVNTDGNIGVFLTTATMTNKSDIYDMQLVIRSTDTHRVASIPFMMNVRTAALDENSSVIEEDKSLFQQYTETVMIALAEIRTDVESEATARSNADSTLLEKINIEAADRAAEDTALNDRIDNIIAPGGAPSAAEVTDARLGADGVLYDTLGEAIRTQFDDVYKNLAYTVNLESDPTTGLLVVDGGIGGTVPSSLTATLEPQQSGAGAPSADNIRPFIMFTSLSMLHAGESGGGGSGNPPVTPFFGGTQNCITGEWTLYQYNSSYSGVTDLTGVRWWSDRDVYVAGTNPSVGAYVVYEPSTPMRSSGQAWGAEAMYPGINQYKMLAYDSVTQTQAAFTLNIETDVANVGDVIDGIADDVNTLQSDMDQTNQALTLLRNEYDITASTVVTHTTLIENNTEDIEENTADIAENAQEISLVKSQIGVIREILTPVSLGTANTGGIQGIVGNQIVYKTTSSYLYYVIPITVGTWYRVLTGQSGSSTYPNYVWFVNNSDTVIAAYGDEGEAGGNTYNVVAPVGATKMIILTFYTFAPTLNTVAYYTLQDQIDDTNDLIGDMPEVGQNVNIGTASTGGLQGGVDDTITVTSAASYHYYTINVNPGEKYKIWTVQTESGNYPHYVFFVDDSDVIKAVYGDTSDILRGNYYTVIVPTGVTKLKVLCFYQRIPAVVKLIASADTVFEAIEDKADVNSFTYYVSPTGSDANNGRSPVSPFLTFNHAIQSGAEIIYAKSGTYDQTISAEDVRVEIHPYDGDEIILSPTESANVGVEFTDSDIKIYGMTVYGSADYTDASPTYVLQRQGFMLNHCSVYLEKCKAIGCRTAGIRCDGSVSELHECQALYNGTVTGTDGFNAHAYEDPDTHDITPATMYLYDCIADHNGDDGVSLHEKCYMYISGGQYSYNAVGGITPHGGCRCLCNGATIDHNKYGIDAFQDAAQNNPITTVLATGNIITNNTDVGLKCVKYNALSVGNVFSGNTSDTYADTGTITTY